MGRGRHNVAAVATSGFDSVVGARRGADADATQRLLLAAARALTDHDLVLEALATGTSERHRRLLDDFSAHLVEDALARDDEQLRRHADATQTTPAYSKRMFVAFEHGQGQQAAPFLHLVDSGRSLPFSPVAHCGLQLAGKTAARRGAWADPSIQRTSVTLTHCSVCAEHASDYKDCVEDGRHPVLEDPAAMTRLKTRARETTAGELDRGVLAGSLASDDVPALSSDAVRQALHAEMAEALAALSHDRLHGLLKRTIAEDLEKQAQGRTFDGLVSTEQWQEVLAGLDRDRPGASWFTAERFAASAGAALRAAVR